MSQFEENTLNRFINQEDMEEFGHNNINSFMKDENAFNEWYSTVGFLSLDPHELKDMIKEVNYQENKLNIMGQVMDIDKVEKFISLYDMVDND
tara:strand:- start:344 stop:622 length:279 start_codon:yes stop_codon:yes gene_type:complete